MVVKCSLSVVLRFPLIKVHILTINSQLTSLFTYTFYNVQMIWLGRTLNRVHNEANV